MKPQETSQHPVTDGRRTKGGRGEGTKTHPPTEEPESKGQMAATARRDATERRRDGTEAPDEAMEAAAEPGRAGYLPEHFDGAAGATTENGKHPRREYNKVASGAS